jgi:hypothetical protein
LRGLPVFIRLCLEHFGRPVVSPQQGTLVTVRRSFVQTSQLFVSLSRGVVGIFGPLQRLFGPLPRPVYRFGGRPLAGGKFMPSTLQLFYPPLDPRPAL